MTGRQSLFGHSYIVMTFARLSFALEGLHIMQINVWYGRGKYIGIFTKLSTACIFLLLSSGSCCNWTLGMSLLSPCLCSCCACLTYCGDMQHSIIDWVGWLVLVQTYWACYDNAHYTIPFSKVLLIQRFVGLVSVICLLGNGAMTGGHSYTQQRNFF